MRSVQTNEFSIILTVDPASTEDVLATRELLGPQTFADGPPHVTLLNGIEYPSEGLVSDYLMVPAISEPLDRLITETPGATVREVRDMPSRAYGPSTTLMVAPDASVAATRDDLICNLIRADWLLHPRRLQTYDPHLTFQLGAVANAAAREKIQAAFAPSKQLQFTGWLLTRLVIVGGKRTFPIVRTGGTHGISLFE